MAKWQYVQPAHTAAGGAGAGVSEIDASNASYTGTVVITGGANITVSTAAGNKVVIVGGAGGAGGSFSAGVSDIGNTLGNTKTVSNQLVLAGGNNVTLSQSTDANGATVTISGVNTVAQSVQTQNLVDLTLSGNTAGAMALVSSGTATLAGGNNVTLSQAGNAITISGPNTSAQQTGISGISASDTLYVSGTVKLTGVGGGVTVSSNTGQRVDISVAAPVAQTVQTQNNVDVTLTGNTSGALALISSGTMSLAGGNNITLSQAGNAVTISGANAGGVQTAISGVVASDSTYTSGTVIISGENNVTVHSSTAAAGVQKVLISGPNTSAQQTAISGIRASDTTYTSGTVTITGVGGGITVSSNTGQRIDLSVAAPVAQTGTQFSAGISGGNTAGDTGTVAGRVVFAGGANITLSGSTNGVSETVSIVGGAGAAGIASIAASNTTYTSGQVEFTGSNMVTVKSSANQRVVIDATQTVQSQNLFAMVLSTAAGGATTGTMGTVSSGTATLAAGNNITLSQSATSNITISGPNMLSAGMSNVGNTAGSTGVVSKRLVMVGSGAISLSQSTDAAGSQASLSILGPATTSLSAFTNITLSVTSDTIKFSVADPPTLAEYRNFERADGGWAMNLTGVTKTAFFFEEIIPGKVKPASVVLQLSNFSTGTLQSFDVHFGVYTFVNSTSAALLGSGSDNFNVSTASSASWSGARNWVLTSPGTVAAISNLTPGNYLFGLMFSAGATGSIAQSLWGVSNTNTTAFPLGRVVPGNNQLSTGTSQGAYPMFGQLSTTVAALPANIVASDLRNQGTATLAVRPWILLRS